MPTAYIKKLAKLNHTTVNKLEKFWSQAKEIAKSEGNGKAWGLITSIFQNKLKKEGYKVKAFKEETREVDDKEFIFKRLSLADCVKQIKDLFYDYFNFGKKYPEYYKKLYNTKVDESTAFDLLPSDDFTVYIEYNDGSKWYSVDNPKLKDLKLTGIKNCIIEYPACTAYFGKDCRIERFDDAEDAPYVVKCMYEPDTLDSTTKNKLDYIKQVKECIKKIWARGTRNQQEFYAKDWTARYSRIVDDCLNAFEEPKVCARMMYIKYHKENPQTRDLNDNHDTDFYTLLKEAKQYFERLKKWKEDDELLNELNKQATASTRNNMKRIIAVNEDSLDNTTKALYDTMNEGSFQYNYRIDDNFMNFVKTTLTDEVESVIRADRGLIKKCIEKRVKSYSIVWDALVHIFLYVIKQHNLKAKLSADKIKNWFAINHTNYKDALKPVVESVDDLREELRNTEK